MTKKQLRQALRNCKEFKQTSRRSIHLDSIDLDFNNSFIDFLIIKHYGKNSIGTLIKHVKVFINEAVDRMLTTNLQFSNKRYKTVEEPTETICHTEKEIKVLYELYLNKNSHLDMVKGLFIISCYSGLRYSDLVIMKKENINKSLVRFI